MDVVTVGAIQGAEVDPAVKVGIFGPGVGAVLGSEASQTTLCGRLLWFCHVTLVPDFTVSGLVTNVMPSGPAVITVAVGVAVGVGVGVGVAVGVGVGVGVGLGVDVGVGVVVAGVDGEGVGVDDDGGPVCNVVESLPLHPMNGKNSDDDRISAPAIGKRERNDFIEASP